MGEIEQVHVVNVGTEIGGQSMRTMVQMSTDDWLAIREVLNDCQDITKAAKAHELDGSTVKDDSDAGVAGAKLSSFLNRLVRHTSALPEAILVDSL